MNNFDDYTLAEYKKALVDMAGDYIDTMLSEASYDWDGFRCSNEGKVNREDITPDVVLDFCKEYLEKVNRIEGDKAL